MWIKNLKLTNFRSYEKKDLEFGQPTTVLVGPNAVGKTNILEAIYLLASGESFRAEKIEEMVRWGEEVAHVVGEILPQDPRTKYPHFAKASRGRQEPNKFRILNSNNQTKLQVVLTRGEVQGKKAAKRAYKVNGVARRKQDMVGQLTAVVFRPEDLDIITDSPSLRRAFLDRVLAQVDRDYRRSLISYEKALRRRNRLLTQIREGEVPRTVLTFWDMLLIKEGEVLTHKRQELVEFINGQAKIEQTRQVVFDFSVISQKRLAQYAKEEVLAGYTLVGPHRDDFTIVTEVPSTKFPHDAEALRGRQDPNKRQIDLSIYGSRGQQRMGVLWLKLCELAFVEEKTGERPVLLLDDIFSELDDLHDQLVMGLLGRQQTIITTTEVDHRFGGVEGLSVNQLIS